MKEQQTLEKIIGLTLLADFYGPLLTDKQQQALNLFYEEDFSLGEIAAACGCTRQAAHDLIRRSEAILQDYESKLGLLERHRQRQALLQQAEQELAAIGITNENFWQIWTKITEL